MTITATSLPIRGYGYPLVEWDASIDRWNVRSSCSVAGPVGDWGTLRVEIGALWTVDAGVVSRSEDPEHAPTDYTLFRGCSTVVEALDFAEPYGETTGSLRIPALTIFDDLSALSLASVDVYRVLPAWLAAVTGRTKVPYWHGFVQSAEVADGKGNTPGVSLQLLGAMFGEISLRAHQPVMSNTAQDVGTWLGRALDPQAYSRPFSPFHFQFDSATTGIELRHRGSRGQMVVDYCDEVLALAQTGSTAWTISRQYDEDGFPIARCYYLREKSEELAGAIQQHFVFAGGFGVAASLSMDPTEVPNVMYGEGLAASGERWRNAVYPMLTEDAPAYPNRDSGPDYPLVEGDEDSDFTADVITQLQGQLRAGGWPDVQITGMFDPDTTTALEALQDAAGVTVTGTITNDAGWDLVWQTDTGTTDLSSGYFRPLHALPATQAYSFASDGSYDGVIGSNDAYDPGLVAIERQVSFGDGIAKSRAIKYAKRLVNQAADALPFVGTVTLTSDPTNEGGDARSRMDVHEGSWLRLNNARGPDGQYVDLYVAGVQVAPEGYAAPVTLTVATKAWDLLDVSTRIERNREARENPAKAFYAQRTRPQRPWREATGWDKESGAGYIRPFAHPGGTWVVKPFVAGGFAGTIQTIRARVKNDPSPWCFAVFANSDVTAAGLNSLIPNPLAEDTDGYGWWLHPDNIDQLEAWQHVETWGAFGNRGGYWPGYEDADLALPVTGKLKDSLGWNFWIDGKDAPFLQGAWWVTDPGTASADLDILISE